MSDIEPYETDDEITARNWRNFRNMVIALAIAGGIAVGTLVGVWLTR